MDEILKTLLEVHLKQLPTKKLLAEGLLEGLYILKGKVIDDVCCVIKEVLIHILVSLQMCK